MKYSKEERLEIGRKIYDGTITDLEATIKFGISSSTARKYLLYYCEQNKIRPKTPKTKVLMKTSKNASKKTCIFKLDNDVYRRLSKCSGKTGISKSIIASKAIDDFLDSVSKSESDSDLVISFLKRK